MAHNDYLPKAFFEGKIVDFKNAKVSVATSALQYGIGCFAGIRGYRQADGKMAIFRLDRHAKRLLESSKMLGFKLDMTEKQIADAIIQTVTANNLDSDIYVRPFIYKSDTDLGPRIEGQYQLAIYVLRLDEYLDSSKGLSLNTSSWIRVPDHAIPTKSKATGMYINAALAIEESNKAGFDSAIMMDMKGDIGEGVVMNLFIVRDGKIITPGLGGDLLEGVTRRSVIEIAVDEGMLVESSNIRRSQLYNAEEAFVTGTAVKIGWINKIDNRVVSPEVGSITQKLSNRFNAIIHGQDSLSSEWLHYVD
jgi:branched-chain amino acid aminotransferase